MRFLICTMQWTESAFYGRVANHLRRRGHEAVHVVHSRRSTAKLRADGHRAYCLPEIVSELPASIDLDAEVARIEDRYGLGSIREIYLSDPAARRLGERENVERTVRHVLALERIFAEGAPNVVVPEVGTEVTRTIAHLIGLDRGLPVLFLFFTIFPRPLRLYVDTYHAPIVAQEEVRKLSDAERAEVEAFIERFTAHGKPILAHRNPTVTLAKLRDFARHVLVRTFLERDNEYLRPSQFVVNNLRQRVRKTVLKTLYERLDAERPFVYFPLHLVDDFKVKRVIPHCVDQEYLIQQVADTLPPGWDVVVKEHPVSIGRNPFSMARRLARRPNIRLVDPHTSSHDLIRESRAVVVISSTVGLEALLYAKPVLTLGQPFYSGYGVTVDVDSFREIREAVPRVLSFEPDRERILQFLHAAMRSTYEGTPGGVDPSDANAARLAASLIAAAEQHSREPVSIPA